MEDSKVKYRVEKKVEDDDNWYYEGTWENPVHLAYAMFNLGRQASVIEDIRIIEEKDNG